MDIGFDGRCVFLCLCFVFFIGEFCGGLFVELSLGQKFFVSRMIFGQTLKPVTKSVDAAVSNMRMDQLALQNQNTAEGRSHATEIGMLSCKRADPSVSLGKGLAEVGFCSR